MSRDLCSHASYRAEQIPGAVVIFANGYHPTSGYKAYFERSPLAIYPPEFILWCEMPQGPVLQVITPFSVYVAFRAEEIVKSVKVTDSKGQHTISVEQVPDLMKRFVGTVQTFHDGYFPWPGVLKTKGVGGLADG